MFAKKTILVFSMVASLISLKKTAEAQHEIFFCGERIPVSNNFVANKLMDIIRRQIPNINLASLRAKAQTFFPYVAGYLKLMGIPEDFKYLPVVESGFNLLVSAVGARGFWQIMPATGREKGLSVDGGYDERDDFQKSTIAACKVLKDNYNLLIRLNKVASWVLAAAAYNFGIGNVSKAVKKQGTDYFTMNLNPETSIYVYKIIAVKELFEYPELYMKGFGYNVFSTAPQKKLPDLRDTEVDEKVFEKMEVQVLENLVEKKTEPKFVAGHISGKYKNFRDGDFVSISLNEDLFVKGGFAKKETVLKGAGWIIDGKVYVDLGYGHDVTLCDAASVKGIPVGRLTKGEPVLLKNNIFDENAQWK
ncbi:MAG: lytic transglycosylase domain-containing protein [Chitinophagaceae bacterium]